MTVKEIVKDYLKKNGCDGLCNVDDFGDDVCGCGVDDLFACKALDACGDIPRCRPAKYNEHTGLYELADEVSDES